jgi:endonuclease/exonuclease/phosphatase family metal-dependent hydrolase
MNLTVANWNIWGKSANYESRLPDILNTLRSVNADVVGLVEVFKDGSELQVEALAHELGYPHWDYAAIHDDPENEKAGTPWGVGVLSRYPLNDRLELLQPNPDSYFALPAVLLITTVDSSFGPFDFAVICEWGLSWSGYGVTGTTDRHDAYQAFTTALSDRSEKRLAPILLGDFNTPPDTDDIRKLTGKIPHDSYAMSFLDTWALQHGVEGGWTFDGTSNAHLRHRPFGKHRIDYIMTGTGPSYEYLWRTNEVAVFGQYGSDLLPPSDHYGVRAVLEPAGLFGARWRQ